ncbi:MAG: DUF5615 family PIN-like protein [Desulfomonilaceae bacterium]
MKLLLDQGLPRSAASILREAGIDTIHVGEIGLSTAGDAVVLQRGHDEGRIIVTLDSDFHAILALSGAMTPSVIRIRIEGLHGKKTASLIQRVITLYEEDLDQGAVVTVQPGRVRIRRLPL